MNYEVTKYILEKLKPYVNIENLNITTESTDWKGRKYKADFVKLDEKHNVGFEVTDSSIITFCFTDHQHFDNYNTDESDTDYIDCAIEFLENLFTLPIRHVEKYNGKKLTSEKYCFIKDGKEESFSGFILNILFRNPFVKKYVKNTIWYYDKELKTFVNDPPIEPDPNADLVVINKDKTRFLETHEKNGVFSYCIFQKEHNEYDGTYFNYWTPLYQHGKSMFDTKEKAIEQAKMQIGANNNPPEIDFSDYISITDKDIDTIDNNGITYKTINGNAFIHFEECACNYERLNGGSGKCVGERDITGSNPSFAFYTVPMTTRLFFLSESKTKILKNNAQQRFDNLQNQIIDAGFTTFDLS